LNEVETKHFCYLNNCVHNVNKYSLNFSIMFRLYYHITLPVSIVTSHTFHFEVLIYNFEEGNCDIFLGLNLSIFKYPLEELYSGYVALLQSLEICLIK
jgi:hypothetical protein